MEATPLHANLDTLIPRVRAGRPLLLFTDFDGTLVPIKTNAADCFLSSEIADLLRTIRDQPNTRLGVVSGRSLADLRPRLGLTDIMLAGNHGLEIEAFGEYFQEPTAVERQPELEEIVQMLEGVLSTVPGVWVEHKGLSATVHYRSVPEDAIPFVIETAQRLTLVARQAGLFVLREGKCVQELRPAVHWHKGLAIHWLRSRLTTTADAPQIVFLGDDNTDEDAFSLLPDEITIRVGGNPTQARYFVNGVREVHDFLRWLREVRV